MHPSNFRLVERYILGTDVLTIDDVEPTAGQIEAWDLRTVFAIVGFHNTCEQIVQQRGEVTFCERGRFEHIDIVAIQSFGGWS